MIYDSTYFIDKSNIAKQYYCKESIKLGCRGC